MCNLVPSTFFLESEKREYSWDATRLVQVKISTSFSFGKKLIRSVLLRDSPGRGDTNFYLGVRLN